MAIKQIKPYLKAIERNLLPAIQSKLGLELKPYPLNVRTAKATYTGELDGNRVIIDLFSNHKNLKDYGNDPVLFANVYYNMSESSAGVLDLTNIPDAVEQIYASLYELGFRSEQDKADEKARQEEEERKAQEELAKEKERKRAELQKDIDAEQNKEVEEPELEELTDTSTALANFDKYLNIMKDGNMINAVLNAIITFKNSDTSFKVLNIDMYYVTSTKCLIETFGINPKIDKVVSWDKAKNYCVKVAEKVNGELAFTAEDAEGNEIILNQDTSDDLDLDIDI